ncbi:MFS transporter [Phenylobacterium montanum]|uniref:MFS transporter n=1 Tax=Phenylobacterium montanum TaxID=2823693 RepID=A0A975G0T5_9CAUL|nr:MFS transporter [Caulobacter sp. S6]QUD88699.1 MFS transporter [Caulobacter sp. S6]
MKADAPASPARAAPVVALCAAVALLEGYDIQAMGVAAPKLAPALHLAPAALGNVFTAGMVGLVLGAAAGGWLADHMRRRILMSLAVTVFGLFSLATAVAPDALSLVAARFLTGLGLGAAMPSLINIVIEVSPARHRARLVSAMACGMPAGGASSGLFAVYAFQHLDWRALFLVGGVLPLALLPFLLTLPETRRKQAEHHAGGAPSIPEALFGEGRAGVTALLWTTFGLTLLVLYLMLNWLPTLVASKGFSASNGAQAALAFNAISIPGALILGSLVDRRGARGPVSLAFAGLIVALLGLAAAHSLPLVLACAGACGFCILGAQYCLYGVTPMYYPSASRGVATGSAVAVGRIGSIVGPFAAGQLVALGVGASGLAIAMAPVILVSGLAAALMTTIAKPFAD